MTRDKQADGPGRRERLRPFELVAVAAGLGIFAGLVVFMGTREWNVAGIFSGVIFIVALVALAMFALAFTPPGDRPTAPDDDEPAGH
ncbi:MAG: hypothetical protein ABJA11_08975 [Pseudolysinimonas sp.]